MWKRELYIMKESFFNKKTPLRIKLLLGIAVAYLFLPFDIVSDFIPLFGQIDDMILIPALIALAYIITPKAIRSEAQTKWKQHAS